MSRRRRIDALLCGAGADADARAGIVLERFVTVCLLQACCAMAPLRSGLLFILCVQAVAGQAFVAFDAASASSVYSAGSFTAEEATAPGSGYWCRSGLHDASEAESRVVVCSRGSAGKHPPSQSVSWTGTLDSRYKAVGVKINWPTVVSCLRRQSYWS